MDLTHPLGVAAGEVVVDRNDVHSMTGQPVQVDGQRRCEGLALTGLHLRDPPEMKGRTSHQLDVVVTLAQYPLGRLAYDPRTTR